MREKISTAELLQAFRNSRNQELVKPVENSVENVQNSRKPFTKGYEPTHRRVSASGKYPDFLEKYNNLEAYIDSFKTQDLMYFFREKAKEFGYKYVIANMKRDMGIFKRLQANYSVREICLMIEFLFFSEQNYLDKTSLQPTVLASSWCNTIYRDSLLWVDDAYIPRERPTTKKERIEKREWKGNRSEENAEIGEWGD